MLGCGLCKVFEVLIQLKNYQDGNIGDISALESQKEKGVLELEDYCPEDDESIGHVKGRLSDVDFQMSVLNWARDTSSGSEDAIWSEEEY